MNWEVFQRDVLDVLRQYEGYLDFFERVGSLSDDSRPDCFARISREDKKEIWVLDAKKKPEIDEEDRQRMEKYLETLKSNPIDVGLELSEISEYEFRGIFVTSSDARTEKFESVAFNSLHQFLQKELIYTDTEKVVRDISKMMERQELSHSQARILFRSLKPYEDRYSEGLDVLGELEEKYVGLEVRDPPVEEIDRDIPVDTVLTHEERDAVFLFDIPYSWKAVKEVDEKAEQVEKVLENVDREVYYAAINTFEPRESSYTVRPGEVEKEVRSKAGILSHETLVDLFEPKIRTEKEFYDGKVIVESPEASFRMAVKSEKDIRHKIQVMLPEKAIEELKNSSLNSPAEFGEVAGNSFYLDIEVDEEFNIETSEVQNFSNFRDRVKSFYQSSVNPVLGRKVSKKSSIQ